ncbi:MAG: hypothetical protein JWM86_1043 [Thermoleophilia bacterium]|nr:hypothetical protein [Thermoleophilia bacterium]
MDGSIGDVLSGLSGASGRIRDSLGGRGRPEDGAQSFTQLLDASLHAHAAQRGYELPIALGGRDAQADPESADAIWDRVVAQSKAGPGGMADAMMDSMSAASDRRWEQRRDRERGGSSRGFEI